MKTLYQIKLFLFSATMFRKIMVQIGKVSFKEYNLFISFRISKIKIGKFMNGFCKFCGHCGFNC